MVIRDTKWHTKGYIRYLTLYHRLAVSRESLFSTRVTALLKWLLLTLKRWVTLGRDPNFILGRA